MAAIADTRGIALDFHGVLADIDLHTQARIEAFGQLAIETGDERYRNIDPAVHAKAHFYGAKTAEIIRWVLIEAGIMLSEVDPATDPTIQRVTVLKKEIYRSSMAQGLDAQPGAVDFVLWAAKAFGPENVAMVTTATRDEVVPYIARHELDGIFGVIVTKENTPRGLTKPHPHSYQRALERMMLEGAVVATVEDSPRGLAAAAGGGVALRFGLDTTHPAEALADEATHVVSSFSQIRDILDPVRQPQMT